ncbi:MAG: DNA polymerase I [Deltaproteobacteria bacterium]|nr:DNA polymerase I [Deltaproteobacteria bacterium]
MSTHHDRPVVHLIDGSGYIYRAYYGVRPLSTSRGEPTHAVNGFARMIKRLLDDEKPTHMAIAFDADVPTFRRALYADYKAHRPPPPEDLIPQIPRIHQVTDSFRIRNLRVPGFEADDIIATLTREALERGFDVVIVSGDKDLMQLVEPRVMLFEPMRNLRYRVEDVVEKFGVLPDQLGDLLALMGDSSDNVPGVTGVGEKTGAKLLLEHGNLEAVLAAASAGRVKGKLGERLVSGTEDARLSKKLVTLDGHVALGVGLDDLAYEGPDVEAQRALFEELEFRNMIPASSSTGETTRPAAIIATPMTHDEYRVASSLSELDAFVSTLASSAKLGIAFDTTTSRMADTDVVGLSIATAPGRATYFPFRHPGSAFGFDTFLERLAPVLSNPEIRKSSSQLQDLVAIAKRRGVRVEGLRFEPRIASYLLDPDEAAHDVRTVARRHLGLEPIVPESLTGTGRNRVLFESLAADAAGRVIGEAADIALRAEEVLLPALARAELLGVYHDVELPLVPVLATIELSGLRIDLSRLKELEAAFEKELAVLERKCHEAAGHEFNIGSPKQLQKILYDELGLKILKNTKTGPSTDASVLEQLAELHELPGAVLEHRQVQKLQNTYVEALPRMICPLTGRVHTRLQQTVAATGRLSSTEPNLQNIPIRSGLGRKLREVFIPSEGNVLISVDYSQIELRVLAHFSSEPVLVSAFEENADVHARTASVIFEVPPSDVTREQRTQAKAVNFGVLYGMGPVRLARQLGIQRRVASKFIDDYFARQPKVKEFIDRTLEDARKTGWVRTLSGRRRRVADIGSKNRATRAAAERIAVNTPIQGSAADVIKMAMIRVAARLEDEHPEAKFLLQVHDELLVEAPRASAEAVARLVSLEMSHAFPLGVPLVAEPHAGKNWDQAH